MRLTWTVDFVEALAALNPTREELERLKPYLVMLAEGHLIEEGVFVPDVDDDTYTMLGPFGTFVVTYTLNRAERKVKVQSIERR